MNKHTPGPWDWQDGRLIGDLNGDGPDVLAIEETGGDYGASHIQTSDADACLIKAAPDMLATLQYVLDAHEFDGALTLGTAALSPAIRDKIKRTIAQAKGEPQ
ncbi:hypothetical protein ACQKOE_07200 [Novosphingobium sp. NPDC080210]|uniref:hypothetical protein n=1 Tax=Novosphingobium sp. NPDC080210 TaxID=3390596 RepID=UPI003D052DAF